MADVSNTQEPLWTQEDLSRLLSGHGTLRGSCTGISIDTRSITQGDLYVAISGALHDGHDFVIDALAKGACGALVHPDFASAHQDIPALFVVEDPLLGLEALARAARARTKARLAAVTGSVGKTSAKDMLAHCLGAQGATHAAEKSFNNHWGVPLTLARLPQTAAFGVFELGMNHAGEILRLVDMVRPQAALITTIGPVHIEQLGSLEAIADAKSEIFTGLSDFPEAGMAERGRIAVLNCDMPLFARALAQANRHADSILTFSAGSNPRADAVLVSYEGHIFHEGVLTNRVDAHFFGQEQSFYLSAAGYHMAQNALGVLLVAHSLGVDIKKACAGLATFHAPAGRGARHEIAWGNGTLTLLDESYNANPVSMRAALVLLAQTAKASGARTIAVLGDMKELGQGAEAYHRALAEACVALGLDTVFCVGALMRACFEALPAAMRGGYAPSVGAVIALVEEALEAGVCVMVKGSNSVGMEQLTKAILAGGKNPANLPSS